MSSRIRMMMRIVLSIVFFLDLFDMVLVVVICVL